MYYAEREMVFACVRIALSHIWNNGLGSDYLVHVSYHQRRQVLNSPLATNLSSVDGPDRQFF